MMKHILYDSIQQVDDERVDSDVCTFNATLYDARIASISKIHFVRGFIVCPTRRAKQQR